MTRTRTQPGCMFYQLNLPLSNLGKDTFRSKRRHNIFQVLFGVMETYLQSLATVCGDAECPNLPTWRGSLKGCLPATAIGTSRGSNRRPVWEDITERERTQSKIPNLDTAVFSKTLTMLPLSEEKAAEVTSVPAYHQSTTAGLPY